MSAVNQRDAFLLDEGIIYLCGNSLGPLSKATHAALTNTIEQEWQKGLVSSWSDAGWIDLSEQIGEKIAPLIGAGPKTVMVADSVSVNIFKLAAAALAQNPDRPELLTEEASFPTDAYILEGLAAMTGKRLRRVKRQDLVRSITDQTALVLATHVHYVTADLIDLPALSKAARDAGALSLIDLSHTVGAVPVDLTQSKIDFAVGCCYKYLNGGPGAPAFAYVAPQHQERLTQPLSGWMGHQMPFAFEEAYQPASGVNRLKCGTPPIISLRALDAALDIFCTTTVDALYQQSNILSQLFIDRIEAAKLDALVLKSPANPAFRGSHVSYAFPDGYGLVQALIDRGVTGDFRQPDIARFGFAPLYLSPEDCCAAADALIDVVQSGSFKNPRYATRKSVT